MRIKGIGTFKAQRMGERKSVDVNSGKVITLPAHTKLSFAPAKDLAAAVNAPFAAFEAVEITDDLTDEELEITDEVPATEPALVNTETPDTQTTTSQDEAGTISQKEDAEESAKEEETAGEELLEEAAPQEKYRKKRFLSRKMRRRQMRFHQMIPHQKKHPRMRRHWHLSSLTMTMTILI